MSRYGYIVVDNLTLSDAVFKEVCDVLKLLTLHYIERERRFTICGIDKNATGYNVDRRAVTKQSVRILDSVEVYLTNGYLTDVRNGLSVTYKE